MQSKPIPFTQKNANRKTLDEVLPAKMPLGLCVEPTNVCNFRCIQCPISLSEFGNYVKYRGHMPMKLWNKIVTDVQNMGQLINLNLYGDGEPFLNPYLIDMITLVKTKKIAQNVTVTTNASLIDKCMARKIVESGLDYLRVSVYSMQSPRFKEITGYNASPGIILENVKTLRAIRDNQSQTTPIIYVKMFESNEEEIVEFKSAYSGIADEIGIELPMNWNGFNGIDLIHQIDPAGMTDETAIQGYYGKKRSGFKKICTTPFLSLNIKANGDVVICIVDWNMGTKVGNVYEESLTDIWFGERLRAFRRMHIEGRRFDNESCKNCKFLYCSIDNMDHFTHKQFERVLHDRPPFDVE